MKIGQGKFCGCYEKKKVDSWALIKMLSNDLTLYNFILRNFLSHGLAVRNSKSTGMFGKDIKNPSCFWEGGSFSRQSRVRARAVSVPAYLCGGGEAVLSRVGAAAPCPSAPSLRSDTDTSSWEVKRRSDLRFQTLDGNVSHPPQPALQPDWEPAGEDWVPAAVRARWPAVFSPQFLCLSTTRDFVSCLSVFAI